MSIKKILLIRPPSCLWPFINESDNFLFPLGLACIAGVIRKKLPYIKVKVIDCPVLKIGWKRVEKIIAEEEPDLVCVAADGVVFHLEVVKLCRLVKEFDSEAITIVGGHFFSWIVDSSLEGSPIDFVVRFEADETIAELLNCLVDGKNVFDVKGIAFKDKGRIIKTPLRPMIENLDSLPMPAFDLFPVEKYAPNGVMWPRSITLEHSRGCVGSCSFCSLWTFWGDKKKTDVEQGELEVAPCYRTKSVDRTLEEIDIVYKKYKRKYIIWADPTFNLDPAWNDEFSEKLLKRKYKGLHWWAQMRADFIVRDEKLGIMGKMVKAGLDHPLIGVERRKAEDFELINKSKEAQEASKEAFRILRQRYPQLFRHASFVTCLPSDTRESMLDLAHFAKEIYVDHAIFQPIIPTPGTYFYKQVKEGGFLENKDLLNYDWIAPILRSNSGISEEGFARLNGELWLRHIFSRPLWLISGLFSFYANKRRLYRGFLKNMLFLIFGVKITAFLGRRRLDYSTAMTSRRKPKWYD